MKEEKKKPDKWTQKVLSYIKKHNMIQAGDHVILGVSGGADSVCLFSVLWELRASLGFEMEVVHINHMLRESAGRDETFVRELCQRWEILFHGRRIDVRAMSEQKGLSLEEAGREARYETFEKIRQSTGANKIAVAHHAGDQAETLLFHLCRGSGMEGLCAIRPVRERLLRPLLCLTREEIEAYLKQRGLSYMTDETNAENTYARNILRNQILPLLEEKICHEGAEHMARTAEMAQEAFDFLSGQTEEAFANVTRIAETSKGRQLQLLLPLFRQLHPYLQKEVLRRCIFSLSESKKDISSVHIEALTRLLPAQVGSQIDLPYRIVVRRGYEELWFEKASQNPRQPPFLWQQSIDFNQKAQQSVRLPDGKSLVFRVFPYEKDGNLPRKPYTKWLDYDKIVEPLMVRAPQDGDFFYFDDKNRKFVKDYMVNEKIPARDRGSSLMVMEEHHMLYFLGKRISNYYKVSDQTEKILEIAVQEDKKDG